MYIRQTTTRRKSKGESYSSHRLVASQRMGDKVRQVTLLNIGSQFDTPPALWGDICARTEQLIGTQTSLFETTYPAEVESVAQLFASQLLLRAASLIDDEADQSVVAATATNVTNAATPTTPTNADFVTVNINSIVDSDPRSIGVEHVGLYALAQLEFEPLLTSLGIPATTRAMMMAQVIARMAVPGSEAATWAWLNDTSALFEQLDVSVAGASIMRLYRAADCFTKHQAAIEAHVFKRATDLFGLEATVTLYDLTNTYFEGGLDDNAQAQYGRSKEKRSDCPLITLGLVLDGSGFVRRSKTFAGNVAEGTTLAEMLNGLHTPTGAMIIMDAGIATEANLTWLREQQYRYLVVRRGGKRQFDVGVDANTHKINTTNDIDLDGSAAAAVAATAETTTLTSTLTSTSTSTSTSSPTTIRIQAAGGQTIQLQKQLSANGQEVLLYCHSEGREAKETAMVTRSAKHFEAGLQKILTGLSKPRAEKRVDKLLERIGRLKAQSHGVGRHYKIDLLADEHNKLAIGLTWTKQLVAGTQATHPGVYCLRSNELSWDAEKLWPTYTTLTDLESVFRSLKSELGLRPVHHITPARVQSHLFITVLAYQCVQLLRLKLAAKGIHESWSRLRKTLSVQRRTTTTMTQQDGRKLHLRKTSKPAAALAAIYDALGINHMPGGTKKTVI